MPVGDVYEVVDVQRYLGQTVMNVYHYQQTAAFVPLAGTIAQALADAFATTIVPVIAGIQHPSLVHVEVNVKNVFDGTDAGTAVTGNSGSQTGLGDAMPAFTNYAMQFKTDNAGIRPGSKRIAGVAEGATAAGIVEGVRLADAQVVADALAAPIQGGLIITNDIMKPVIVKRVREGVYGSYTYRMPATSAELVVGKITEALVNVLITSQTSRKVGVGI